MQPLFAQRGSSLQRFIRSHFMMFSCLQKLNESHNVDHKMRTINAVFPSFFLSIRGFISLFLQNLLIGRAGVLNNIINLRWVTFNEMSILVFKYTFTSFYVSFQILSPKIVIQLIFLPMTFTQILPSEKPCCDPCTHAYIILCLY